MATKCPKCHSENPESKQFCADCGTRLIPSKNIDVSVTRTLETPADEFVRGTVFASRYEVLEELGGGGMGKVYRVYDRKLEEEVALKLIRPEIAADRKAIERFRNEIKVSRKITHKNVCKMYDLGESGGASYIAMEYVPGEDLRSFIHRSKQLTVATAVSITRQVAEGLSEAHSLGIIHRDLKPGNIMIDKEGNAKIMDFGIARSLLGKGLTGEGAIIGTPEYMSPEQVEGKETDQRADIYALGVILFEMLVGSPPFEGETPFAVANKHKTEPPPVPKKLLPQLPDALNKIILRCLEKDRVNRYPTAGDLLTDLSAVEQTLPTADRALTRARTKPRASREITVKLTPRKALFPVLVAAAVIIIALFGRRFFLNEEPAPAPKIENSIAVISLRNQTGDKSYDYLCQRAIPDLLITNLENSGHFYVATWERMLDLLAQMGKKGVESISDLDGFQVCRREGIRFIVLGSLTKAGETFMTDVKILDADTKTLVKAIPSRGRGESSILESQIDELSREICVGMGFGKDMAQTKPFRISDVTTTSMEAYQSYLKGLDLFWNYRFEEARAALEKAVKIDPSFASAYRWLANSYLQLYDQEAASHAAAQAVRFLDRTTEKERALIEVSLTVVLRGKWEKHRPILEALVAKYPRDKEVHFWLSNVLDALGDKDGAIREMSAVVEFDPNLAEAWNTLALWHASLGACEKAVKFGKKYASLLPQSANPQDTLGSIYASWGKVDEAIASYKKAIGIDPGWSRVNLAYLSALREDFPGAMTWLDRQLQGNPPAAVKAEASLFKGFLEAWQGQFKQSLADMDRALKIYENLGSEKMTGLAEYCRAAGFCEQGEYEIGQNCLKSAFELYGRIAGGQTAEVKAELAYNMGWTDLMLDRLDSAGMRLAEVEAGLMDISSSPDIAGPDPSNLKAKRTLKKIEYLRDLLKAEISLKEGKVDPDSVRVAFADPPSYLPLLGDVIYMPEAVNVNFHLPLVKDTLGRAYVQTGELDKAIGIYERLTAHYPINKDPRLIHPLLHYRLAKLYDQIGRKDKARASYKKFLEFWKDADPGRPEVEDARNRLSRLG